jgi:hypothetical protein
MTDDAKPSQADIARALGLSRAAVCKAVAKGMPTNSVEAARAWRDARPRRRLGAKETLPMPPVEPITREGVATETATPPTPSDFMNPLKPATASEQADFDEIAIKQAEIVQLTAFRFYEQSLPTGSVSLISGAIKNWGEAGKVAATLRERYLALREKSRQLVDLDVVIAGVGIEVGEWRRLFDTLGTRLAGGRISAEAAKEVQAEIERVKRDLMPRAEMVARAMFAPPEDAPAPGEAEG